MIKRQPSWVCCAAVALFWICLAVEVKADEVERALAAILQTGPMGKGSAQARAAGDVLARQGVQILPRLLEALDTDNPVAANWLRTAFEDIVAQEAARPQPDFPLPLLKAYVRDGRRAGPPRRRVLELLDQLQPDYRAATIPQLLDDPEFRSDAVAAVLAAGDQARSAQQPAAARAAYERAFSHARQSGQITAAADRLKALGFDVSIIEQMGFVTRWYLLGPFEAPGTSGFDRRFPPEDSVDLGARYQGKGGQRIAWKLFETTDRMGQLNLIQAIDSVKEAVGYAYTELIAEQELEGQLRCGADDNLSVWLNGAPIFARRQWLNGTRLDRFTAPARFRAGRNTVLVKVCQGPQHRNPAVPNNWSLQVRFCDATGAGLPLKNSLPAPRPKDP